MRWLLTQWIERETRALLATPEGQNNAAGQDGSTADREVVASGVRASDESPDPAPAAPSKKPQPTNLGALLRRAINEAPQPATAPDIWAVAEKHVITAWMDAHDKARGLPATEASATAEAALEAEQRLDALFTEAFSTNEPAMLDYAALKMELKALRSATALNARAVAEKCKQIVLEEGPRSYPNTDRIVQRIDQFAATLPAEAVQFAAQLSEPVAWLYTLSKPGKRVEFASIDPDDSTEWPKDQWTLGYRITPLYIAPTGNEERKE
jgi:hypothetical protein